MNRYRQKTRRCWPSLLLALACLPACVECPDRPPSALDAGLWYVDEEGCAVGEVWVSSAEELAEISGIRCFRNTLHLWALSPELLRPGVLDDIERARAIVVERTLALSGGESQEDMGVLSLPNLTETLYLVAEDNRGLRRIEAPRLTEAISVEIEDSDSLEVLSLEGLEWLRWWLEVSSCPSLSLVDLPSLSALGQWVELEDVGSQGAGAVISLPALEDPGLRFRVAHSHIDHFDMPMLTRFDGVVELWGGSIGDPASLSLERGGTLGLSSWTAGERVMGLPTLRQARAVHVVGAELVQTLSFPALKMLGELHIDASWALREVDLPQLDCVRSISVEVHSPARPSCLLPEAFDDVVARSLAHGCETALELHDPRADANQPYDPQVCE